MMDFLVQATTSNKITPSGHIINVISKDERNVSYKPNTPIGSLDASTVYIIPKSTLELPVKRMPKLANQPFEVSRILTNKILFYFIILTNVVC